MRSAAALTCCLLGASACGEASPKEPAPASASAAATDFGPARFSVRGRWPDPSRIRLRIEADQTAVANAAFQRAVERAMKLWNDTGCVGFVLATADEPADVTMGWRRGKHDACEAFGPSSEVAHTGPSQPGTFVHFDLARPWSEQGPDGASMFHTALHELGHVLGLGHSDAPGAVMSTDVLLPATLSRHELAGLHSLYGGGSDGDGDLQLVRADGSIAVTLRDVAPPSCCAFAAFDCDGDARDEVLVWRTDAGGYGALMIYFFDSKPALVRTFGAFYGAVAPAARVGFAVGPAGERWLVSAFAQTPPAVRQFTALGLPAMPTAPPAEELLARATARDHADFDGDGVRECVVQRPAR